MGAASENSAGGRIDGIDGIDGSDSSAVVQERHDSVVDIYRREYSGIARLAFLLVGDRHQAEDLAHDAFVRLYEHWDDLDDRGNAVGYLRTTTAKLAMTVHRRNRTRRKYAAATESLLGAANAVSAEAEALSRSARPVARDNDDVARHHGPRDDRAADDRSRGRATRDRTAGADTPCGAGHDARATAARSTDDAPSGADGPADDAHSDHDPTSGRVLGESDVGHMRLRAALRGTLRHGDIRGDDRPVVAVRIGVDECGRCRALVRQGVLPDSAPYEQFTINVSSDQRSASFPFTHTPFTHYPHPLTRESVRLEQNLGDEW